MSLYCIKVYYVCRLIANLFEAQIMNASWFPLRMDYMVHLLFLNEGDHLEYIKITLKIL